MAQMNVPHWKNWIACIKSREKPTSEIETCVRSSTVCLLGNLAMRHKTFLDWDERRGPSSRTRLSHFSRPTTASPGRLEV